MAAAERRTAYYARRNSVPGPRATRDAELTEQITTVHQRSRGTYGAPRVHAVLQREGVDCGRPRVARLMRQPGLAGRTRRRQHRTTIPDPHASNCPDLALRNFQPDRPQSTPAGVATSLTSPPAASSAGPPPTFCEPNSSPTPCAPPGEPAARPAR
ncbi:IS3 family transposase [Streptomyces sp. NPDC005529]|uniref:IS3 family transposase n=1 Tax=unclassified Streptomyces TaxID=2593676 RepID=UPI0033BED276